MKTKYNLITLTLLLVLLISCSNKETLKIKSALKFINQDSLPELISEFIVGNDISQIDTSNSSKLLVLRKTDKNEIKKEYVILHNNDTSDLSYITIISNKQIETTYCCTKLKESYFKIDVYRLENGNAVNITSEALPNINIKRKGQFSLSKNFVDCKLIIPLVYPDSIVMINETTNDKILLKWNNGNYISENTKDAESRFFQCYFQYKDSSFVEFISEFKSALALKDTNTLKKQIMLPLQVDKAFECCGSIDTTFFRNDFNYLYDNFFTSLLELNYIDFNKGNYSTEITKNEKCGNILNFESSAFQIYQDIVILTFTKTCEGYKLSRLHTWPIVIYDGY